MFLIKLGGSLFSPKDKNNFVDHIFLKNFYSYFSYLFNNNQTILLHGTGNIGHGFVETYGLSEKTYELGRDSLDSFFTTIDGFFPEFKRFLADDIMEDNFMNLDGNIIAGGDISKNISIISSDDLFSFFLEKHQPNVSYLLTDIDGVLDKNNNIIPLITKENLSTIEFWDKTGDVTGSMYNKIKKIFDYSSLTSNKKEIWICNGYNFSNTEKIFLTQKGIGTKIIC